MTMTEIEEQRRDCLAKHIASLPTLEERRHSLAQLKLHHGGVFVEDIEARVKTIWIQRKEEQQCQQNP